MATFKARARALDMLGRQQIAGIPTAINELFKNAHDAYADRVEVDFYRPESLFVLRDDGIGMTRADFETRWLTLGTESKVVSTVTNMELPKVNADKPRRPILGEKGIGRLAIAAIGPQVLVLTRAISDDGLSNLTAAFVQWSLFQSPGINLDQIQIPMRTYSSGSLPTRKDITAMVDEVIESLSMLAPFVEGGTLQRIRGELTAFSLDPAELDASLSSPSLRGSATGTHFFIMPTDPSLAAAIDERADKDSAPALKKMLLGFTNTMTPNHPAPQIRAMFRDHRTDDNSEELIDEQSFFGPEEFLNADHSIVGKFDAFGQFLGNISVYGEDHLEHIVAWDEAKGKRTDCGPFTINVAYVQGVARESTLPPDDWARLIAKLGQIGGLYIYRDNVRILPYGNNDYDFLDIERNRSKSGSYYFFSYRRMFGVIEIDQVHNAQLTEKAGREGFRENLAYRQFRAILMNFFLQIAADFFREGSPGAERFIERRAELDRVERARRKRDLQVSAKRKAFSEKLESFFSDVAQGKPQLETDSLLRKLTDDVNAAITLADNDGASRAVLQAEAGASQSLLTLRRSFRIAKPNGVGLTKQQRRDFEASTLETERLEEVTFAPAEMAIAQTVGRLAAEARLNLSVRVRIERSISERIDDTQKRALVERKETRDALETLNKGVTDASREIAQDVDVAIQRTRSNLASFDMSGLSEKQIVERRSNMEADLSSVADRSLDSLNAMKEDLLAMHWSRDEDGRFIGMSLMNEALQEDLLAMRERSEADLELTQVGMALTVVNHEFESSIKAVRASLRRLKSWADVNQDLEHLYVDLRSSFDHIDGYLSLFTPLQRRLYRSAIDFTGADITKFLTDLFGRRLMRHSTELKASPAFMKHSIHGFPSSFYPVFVNLIDNAIFWVKDRPQPRIIVLDLQADTMIVRDSGAGVNRRDITSIFELGFTRKPGGRGLGLHIAQEVLSKAGYELILSDAPASGGAEFHIRPVSIIEENS
jgi:signal transduction histidine kinase